MTRPFEDRPSTPRRHRAWILVAGAAVGAVALAGCLPPKPAPNPPTPARAPAPAPRPTPTPTPSPPALPAAPSGVGTSAVLTDGVVENFPDPFVLRVDDPAQCGTDPAPCYYAYSTAAGFLNLVSVPVWRSSDLATWHWVASKDAMPNLASWVQFGGNWAPSVVVRPLPNNAPGQQYVMYYTAKTKDSNPLYRGVECVGVATSSSPEGPFVDNNNGLPLQCQTTLGGTIDPYPFVATDGSLSLSYTNNFGIFTRPLNADGLSFSGTERKLLDTSSGFSWDNTHIEGPSMISTPATGILLFYSSGDYRFSTYRVGVARCNTPLGPCTRIYSSAVLASRGSMFGPGGETPFQVPDGSWRMAFHAWDNTVGYPAGGKRSLHFLPLTFPFNRPKIG